MANLTNKMLAGSYSNAAAVTKSDATVFSPPARGIHVGGTGAIQVDMAGGQTAVLFSGIPSGTFLPLAVTKIYSTNTTATLMVIVW